MEMKIEIESEIEVEMEMEIEMEMEMEIEVEMEIEMEEREEVRRSWECARKTRTPHLGCGESIQIAQRSSQIQFKSTLHAHLQARWRGRPLGLLDIKMVWGVFPGTAILQFSLLPTEGCLRKHV